MENTKRYLVHKLSAEAHSMKPGTKMTTSSLIVDSDERPNQLTADWSDQGAVKLTSEDVFVKPIAKEGLVTPEAALAYVKNELDKQCLCGAFLKIDDEADVNTCYIVSGEVALKM